MNPGRWPTGKTSFFKKTIRQIARFLQFPKFLAKALEYLAPWFVLAELVIFIWLGWLWALEVFRTAWVLVIALWLFSYVANLAYEAFQELKIVARKEPLALLPLVLAVVFATLMVVYDVSLPDFKQVLLEPLHWFTGLF